jgi:hypothetical protein
MRVAVSPLIVAGLIAVALTVATAVPVRKDTNTLYEFSSDVETTKSLQEDSRWFWKKKMNTPSPVFLAANEDCSCTGWNPFNRFHPLYCHSSQCLGDCKNCVMKANVAKKQCTPCTAAPTPAPTPEKKEEKGEEREEKEDKERENERKTPSPVSRRNAKRSFSLQLGHSGLCVATENDDTKAVQGVCEHNQDSNSAFEVITFHTLFTMERTKHKDVFDRTAKDATAIVAKYGGKCLTAKFDGSVDLATCDQSPAQNWRLSNGKLYSLDADKCVGVEMGFEMKGAKLALFLCDSEESQIITLKYFHKRN